MTFHSVILLIVAFLLKFSLQLNWKRNYNRTYAIVFGMALGRAELQSITILGFLQPQDVKRLTNIMLLIDTGKQCTIAGFGKVFEEFMRNGTVKNFMRLWHCPSFIS